MATNPVDRGATAGPGAQRPAAVFHNQAAASARTWRIWRTIGLVRAALDADLHVTASRDPDALVAWLDERIDTYRTAVMVGGDGTLAVAYNLVAGRDGPALGYVPAGFGNATASLLRLPRDPVTLTAVVAGGEARPVDLVAVDGRLALFAGAGWDAIVAERYAAGGAHRLLGWTGAIVRSLPDLARRATVQVEADGRLVHEGPMEMLVVSTTPWYGRGLLVNPGARPDSGRLTARIYTGWLPRLALDAARWAAHRRPSVEPLTAETIVVRRMDGEPLAVQGDGDLIGRRSEWSFTIRPGAVRLIGRW